MLCEAVLTLLKLPEGSLIAVELITYRQVQFNSEHPHVHDFEFLATASFAGATTVGFEVSFLMERAAVMLPLIAARVNVTSISVEVFRVALNKPSEQGTETVTCVAQSSAKTWIGLALQVPVRAKDAYSWT